MIVELSKSEFKAGVLTVGTSASRLQSDEGLKAYVGVKVQASESNTGNVYVGSAPGVSSSNGWLLDAGESIEILVDSPYKIWVIGSEADQVVKWLSV